MLIRCFRSETDWQNRSEEEGIVACAVDVEGQALLNIEIRALDMAGSRSGPSLEGATWRYISVGVLHILGSDYTPMIYSLDNLGAVLTSTNLRGEV